MTILEQRIQLALVGAQQSQLRARYYEQRIATGAWRDRIGKAFHGFVTDTNKVPLSENELLQDELATMERHIKLAEDWLDSAKSLISHHY